jgi:hypothetical protein
MPQQALLEGAHGPASAAAAIATFVTPARRTT